MRHAMRHGFYGAVLMVALASRVAAITPTPTGAATPILSGTPTRTISPTWTVTFTSTPTPCAACSPTVTPTLGVFSNDLSVSIFNAAGEKVRDIYLGRSDAVPASLSLSAASFYRGTEQVVLSMDAQLSPPQILAWDGSGTGPLLPPGVYSFVVVTTPPAGSSAMQSLSVTLLLPPTPAQSTTATFTPTVCAACPGTHTATATPGMGSATMTPTRTPSPTATPTPSGWLESLGHAVSPQNLCIGQMATVTFRVRNSGTGAVNHVHVLAAPPLFGPGSAVILATPTAVAVLPPGASADFEMLIQATGSGTFFYDNAAGGTDAATGAVLQTLFHTSGYASIGTCVVTATPSPTACAGCTLTATPTLNCPGCTPTFTPTVTQTRTDTPFQTPTATPTWTATMPPCACTMTSTPTACAGCTSTATPTISCPGCTVTFTPSPTATPTRTPTISCPGCTPTFTRTVTLFQTPTATPTDCAGCTLTATPAWTRTRTSSPTPSRTLTPACPGCTPTFSPTVTPTRTDTAFQTPTATPTACAGCTLTATPTWTRTRTSSPTPSRTLTPACPGCTPTVIPTVTQTRTDTAFQTPTATPTPDLTAAACVGPLPPQPCVYIMIYAPVCGCDGNTYSNSNAAACQGILSYTAGICGSGATPIPTPVPSASTYSYPNPATGSVSFALQSPGSGEAVIDVLNSAGVAVARLTQRISAGLNSVPMELGSYAPGMYFYQVRINLDDGGSLNLPARSFMVSP
jgi:hypothetical protein